MVSSLTELAAGAALTSHNQTSRLSSLMTAAASGNRINRAMDDIASLSAATALSTQTSSLRAAAMNIAQANSFLGVADGAMDQIGSMLDRLQALAVQGSSDLLSDTGRQGINAEAQGILSDIDRLAGNTNFNGVNLIDGSLSNATNLQTETEGGSVASGSLDFTSINSGDTINLNNVTLTEGVDFDAGASTQESVSNLAAALNNDDRFAAVNFAADNTRLNIGATTSGEAGNQFTIDTNASSAAFTVAADALGGNGVFSLQGGVDGGLSAGSVSASGIVGDSLIASGTGQVASASIVFSGSADIGAGNTLSIGDGEGGTVDFEFVNGAPASPNQIEIGATLEETLENAANTINQFQGQGDFGVRQLSARIDGDSLVLQGNQIGDVVGVDGATAISVATTTGGNLSNAAFDNGSVGGIDVSNVTAEGFIGQIGGFEATFTGNNQVNLSVNVGNETFRATGVNTNDTANQTVTFASENGGSFNVTLAGGQGQAVSNASEADNFAARFDAAFDDLTFRQSRDVSNFNPTGDLAGASLSLNSNDFAHTEVGEANIVDGRIQIQVGDETFRSTNVGNGIGAGEQVTLQADNGDSLTLTNGDTRFDLSTTAGSELFTSTLEISLSPFSNNAAFQISTGTDGALQLGIGDLTTQGLGLLNIDLLSASASAEAFAAVGTAIQTLTSQRADVGAFQQALDFAANNVEVALQNQEAARSSLADTDIAANSTQTSLVSAAREASLNTLAQTNRLQANLLQLIQ